MQQMTKPLLGAAKGKKPGRLSAAVKAPPAGKMKPAPAGKAPAPDTSSARVAVRLKPSILDPQGISIKNALSSLGFKGILSVRQGKLFDIEIAAGKKAAHSLLTAACDQLLANDVIEDYIIEIH